MLSRFVHIWFCDCLQCRCQIIIMVWFQFNFHFVPKIKTKNQTSYQQTYQSQVNKKCRKISNGTQQDVPAVAAAFLSMSSLCSSPTLSQFSRSYICSTAHCFRASQFSPAHFSSAQLLIASMIHNSYLLNSHLLNCSLHHNSHLLISHLLNCSLLLSPNLFLLCSAASVEEKWPPLALISLQRSSSCASSWRQHHGGLGAGGLRGDQPWEKSCTVAEWEGFKVFVKQQSVLH